MKQLKNPMLVWLHIAVLCYSFSQFFISDQTIFVVFLAYLAASSLLKENENTIEKESNGD